MPLYEYACSNCGQTLEIIQKFSDDPLTQCPKCNDSLEKVLSAPAVHFKGSGWYVTDYGGKNSGENEAKETSNSSKSKKEGTSDSSEGKSEKKPKKSSKKEKNSNK